MLGKQTNLSDWTFIQMASPRQVRFVMDESIRRKWYSRKFFEFFRVIPGAQDLSTRNTIIDLLDAGEVVCPWYQDTSGSVDWLTALRGDSEKPAQGVILPFSLVGSPGNRPSRPKNEVNRKTRDNNVTITFDEPQHANKTPV